MKITKQRTEFIHMTANALKIIEIAGRTCYKSEKRINKSSARKFIKNLIRNGHESVLEHAGATYKIVTDRATTHQLVRHRIASYSQESQRYVSYKGKGVSFIDQGLKGEAKKVWKESCRKAEEDYMNLVYLNVNPEIARSVLPNCTKTEIVVTMNFRAWRNFFKLRTSKKAHPLMRALALEILNDFKKLIPEVVSDLK